MPFMEPNIETRINRWLNSAQSTQEPAASALNLRHAYGPLPAFLYAWALLFMIHSGTIATSHTSRTAPREGNWAAMALGRRKIPDPMIVPTTIAMASKRLRSFRKVGGEVLASPVASGACSSDFRSSKINDPPLPDPVVILCLLSLGCLDGATHARLFHRLFQNAF